MGNYAGLTVLGANRYDNLGRAVADAGDVNGDGFADILVTAPYFDGAAPYSNIGAVYVVFGTADGPATLDVADLDGSNGYLLTQTNNPEQFDRPIARLVAGVGDLNGDGFDDIAIAGRTYTEFTYENGQSTRTSQTEIYVVFGTNANTGPVVLVETAPGFEVLGVNGRVNGLSSAGDLDGDGFDDLLISQSPQYGGYYGQIVGRATGQGPDGAIDPSGSYGGFVILGDASLGGDGAVDVGLLDGTDGFAIAIERSNVPGYFGEGGFGQAYATNVTAIGDVDGDGFDDLFGQLLGAHP